MKNLYNIRLFFCLKVFVISIIFQSCYSNLIVKNEFPNRTERKNYHSKLKLLNEIIEGKIDKPEDTLIHSEIYPTLYSIKIDSLNNFMSYQIIGYGYDPIEILSYSIFEESFNINSLLEGSSTIFSFFALAAPLELGQSHQIYPINYLLAQTSDKVTEMEQDILLQLNLETLQLTLDTLESDLGNLESGLDTLEGRFINVNKSLEEISDSDKKIKNSVSEIKDKISDIKKHVDKINNQNVSSN